MGKVWQSLKCVLVLLLATVWLLTMAHTVACHSENVMCGHDGCPESAVCTCVCHIAYEHTSSDPTCTAMTETAFVPSLDETIRGLLLPCDIFRPPLANS
jgi:hypothetical protein